MGLSLCKLILESRLEHLIAMHKELHLESRLEHLIAMHKELHQVPYNVNEWLLVFPAGFGWVGAKGKMHLFLESCILLRALAGAGWGWGWGGVGSWANPPISG